MMAVATTRGHSKHRPARSSRSSASSKHHKSTRAATEDGEVKQPDIDELRRRRGAYFGRPVAERHKVIRPIANTVAITAAGSAKDDGHKHKKRAHKGSSSKSTRRSGKSERTTNDYVYAPRSGVEESSTEPATTRSSHKVTEDKTHKGHSRRRSNQASSHKQMLPTLAETEVTPDDSISVVAERRTSRSHGTSSRSRPSLQRSSTTSSKLETVREKPGDSESHTTSRKSSKRDSTLFGSLRRRQSSSTVPAAPRLVECLTCGSDDIPRAKSAKLACGHRMCHDCLKRIFELSVKDPAHMPPRCCTDDHIPLKHVDKLFDVKFKVLWNRKYQEYHTKNRIYCCAPKCGEWIKPSHFHRDAYGRKYAQCPRCKTKVCTLCNNKMHRASECPKDPEITKLVEQAKEKGWQRCFNCNSMVELKEGCNHMTCRCTAEFCMICGAKWKTCDCPWFNYTSPLNPDRLREMRVPEPIQVLYRRVFNGGEPVVPPRPARQEQDEEERQPQQRQQDGRQRDMTYQDEINQRRRQERLDADLARRLQLASLIDTEDEPPPQRRGHMETWGLGNAAGHFLNENFVQDAANVVMNAFGDANLGRRGERASGRRRRARQSDQDSGNGGLVGNFLGDESVLGVGPATRPEQVGARE